MLRIGLLHQRWRMMRTRPAHKADIIHHHRCLYPFSIYQDVRLSYKGGEKAQSTFRNYDYCRRNITLDAWKMTVVK